MKRFFTAVFIPFCIVSTVFLLAFPLAGCREKKKKHHDEREAALAVAVPGSVQWMPTPVSFSTPSPRSRHHAFWTGNGMVVWGGISGFDNYAFPMFLGDGGIYNPSTGQWQPIPAAPVGAIDRYGISVTWTGAQMIVWGGYVEWEPPMADPLAVFDTGGIYTPGYFTWTETSTGAGCPLVDRWHCATWTGDKLIIWGGNNASYTSCYDPAGDTWFPISPAQNSPGISEDIYLSRDMLWTGDSLLFFYRNFNNSTFVFEGPVRAAEYYPDTDTWNSLANSSALLLPAPDFKVLWTGTKAVLWGYGVIETNNGLAYDYANNSWTSTSTGPGCPEPAPAEYLSYLNFPAGNRMIIWTYGNPYSGIEPGGGIYDSDTDSWTPMSGGPDLPSLRFDAVYLPTGNGLIIWGGYYTDFTPSPYIHFNDGGVYDIATDNWQKMDAFLAPLVPRWGCSAIWTGESMIIWGGVHAENEGAIIGATYLNTGGIFTP